MTMNLKELLESDDLYTRYFQRRSFHSSQSDDSFADSERGSSVDVGVSASRLHDAETTKAKGPVPLAPHESVGDDSTDNIRERIKTLTKRTLPLYDVVVNAVSIVFRFVGIGFSVLVAIDYYWKGSIDYMVYTIMCLVIPILMTSFISIELHNRDAKRRRAKNKYTQTVVPTPPITLDQCVPAPVVTMPPTLVTTNGGSKHTQSKAAAAAAKTHAVEQHQTSGCCNFCLGVIIVPYLFRYWLSFWYSLKCYLAQERGDQQKQRYYYKLMIQQDSDVTFLRLFDTFIEVAPQKVLQIGIYLSGKEEIGIMQAILIASCFISMAWCIGSYHRCVRLALPDKNNMKFAGIIVHLMFNFFLSVSRTLSIALVASIFPRWTLIAVIMHILFMGNFIYILGKPYFCAHNCFTNYFFSLMLGTVFLFHFISTSDGPQKFKILFFYIVCGLENIACSAIFYLFVNKHVNLHYQLFILIIWICFVFGLAFKVVYYRFFHPNVMARLKGKADVHGGTPTKATEVIHRIGNNGLTKAEKSDDSIPRLS